jgi:hypothetical protein
MRICLHQALAEHLSQSALMALSVARGQLTDEDATAILCLGRWTAMEVFEARRRNNFWGFHGGLMGFHDDLMVM